MSPTASDRKANASIYLAVAVGFVLVIGVLYGLSIRPLSQAIERMNRERLEESLSFSVWGINNIIDKHVSLARQIASRTAIRKRQAAYLAGEVDRQAFLDFSLPKLRDAVRAPTGTDQRNALHGIARLAPDGELLYQVGDIDPEPWMAPCAEQREGVSLLGVEQYGKDWMFLYCSVMEHPPQGIVGLDLVAIDGVDLVEFLERFSNKSLAFAFSDGDGTILFDGNPSATPAAIAALNAALLRLRTGSSALTDGPLADAADKTAMVDDEHFAVRTNPTSLPGLTLNAVIDTETLNAPVTAQQRRLLIALPITLALVAGLVLLGLRPLLRRLAAQSRLAASRGLYQQLFQSSDAIMLLIDPETEAIVEANPAAVDYYGYSREELLQRHLADLREAVAGDSGTRAGRGNEFCHRRAQGNSWVVEMHSRPLSWEMRGVLFTIIEDITERKQAEFQLRQFRQVIEESERGVTLAGPDGVLFYANAACAGLFRMDCAELIGRRFVDFHQDASPEELAQLEQAILTTGQWRGLLPARDARGRAFPLACAIGTLKGAHGEVQVIFNLMQDFSPEMDRQTELCAARDTAEQANRAKSEFLSQMSHELRTPLNAVIGFAQLLETSAEEPLSDNQAEQVADIRKGGEHLLTLIDNILDFVSADAGEMSLSLESVAVSDALKDSRRLVQPMAKKAKVAVVSPPTHARVRADLTRLKQVLVNLLSNGVKYNHVGGQVQVSVQEVDADAAADTDTDKGPRCRISVRDTGPGLTTEQRARLFQPFERLGAEVRGIEGTGIGLVLTRQLVHAMGGTIGVETVPGQGSTFWIELPAAKNGAEDAPMAASALAQVAALGEGAQRPQHSPT